MSDVQVQEQDQAPEVPQEAPEAINIVEDHQTIPPKLVYPGMIDKTLTELHRLTSKAQQGTDAVGIDKAAQNLWDDLLGCYGKDVAELFTLPTIDKLIELNVAEEVDWDRGKALADKVNAYIALAEDYSLTGEQVEGLKDSLSEWENYLPKKDRAHQAKRDKQDKATDADMPFAVRITFNGEEVSRPGERTGSFYWSPTWTNVQSTHHEAKLNRGKFSPAMRDAMRAGKKALLDGAQHVQVGDYLVDRI